MTTVRQAVLDAVAALRAAGVRATADPSDTSAAVVELVPVAAAPSAAAGCWVVDVEARLWRSGPASDPLEPWGDRLDVVLQVLGADEVRADTDPDGTTSVVVRAQLTT